MASVDIIQARKSFGKDEILHGVDIPIEDGEFVVLVGPSGCGKSTLLRMLAGLENISSGEIHIGGRIVNKVHPKERDVAMVFQNYALYPHMTVSANMGFSLLLRKSNQKKIDQRVAEAAEILGLTPYLERYPRQLSGGQRQRNLDAKLRVQMRKEIKELHQRLKTTTIYVTHDQIEAMTMADKIVVMNDGNVEQIGAPLELYDNPRNMFVAGFIGSPAMNFMEGTLVPNGVQVAGGDVLPLHGQHGGSEGQPVHFGIRPEYLELADDGIQAECILVEPTGSETQLFARYHGREVVAVFRERHAPEPGEIVNLRPMNGTGVVFDRESGQRL